MCPHQKHFSAQNALNIVWRPGFARTRWGSLQALQLSVVLGLAIFVQLRLVTDRRTDGQTHDDS